MAASALSRSIREAATTRLARLLSIALAAVFGALPAAAFDASDLEGSWYASSIQATTATNDPVLVDLDLTVAADGTTSGQSTTYPDSAPKVEAAITGGSLAIDSEGRVNGSISVAGGLDISVAGFQMSPQKDLISGVGAPAPDTYSFFTLVKRGASYSDEDLEGTWWLYGFFERIDDHYPGWIWGEMTVSSSAEISGGELHYQYDPNTYSISGDLVFEGDPEPPGGIRIESSTDLGGDVYLTLAEGKTLMIGRAIGWATAGGNEHRLFLLVKEKAGAARTDMAGDWYLTSFYDTQAEIEPGTTEGTLTINAEGTEVTGGLLDDSDGSKLHVTGGDVNAPDSEGYVRIDYLTYEGTTLSSTLWLNLSPDRDVVFGISEENDGYASVVVATKAPEAGAGLLGLAGLMALAALRTRAGGRRRNASARAFRRPATG